MQCKITEDQAKPLQMSEMYKVDIQHHPHPSVNCIEVQDRLKYGGPSSM